jgi:uncharacterized protein YecE (DUF72 family)
MHSGSKLASALQRQRVAKNSGSKAPAGKIEFACGSWSDEEYIGVLYPKGLPAADRLKHYATHFNSVEVNSSYYKTPRREAVDGWVRQTPPGFTFNIKLHRALSQSPAKVVAEGRLLKYLMEGIQPLIEAQKLGALLLTLAPYFTPEKHELEELDALVEQVRPHLLAVELRHSDWVSDENREKTLAYFRARQATFVCVDMPRIKNATLMPPFDAVTNPRLAYLRLHGRNKNYLKAKSAAERHTFEYGGRDLEEVVARIKALAEQADMVRVIANNHAQDFAPKTALALKALLNAEESSPAKSSKRIAREKAAV